MITAYIGIGSNLDQPHSQVQRALTALAALPRSQLTDCSPWFGSKAVGPGVQADYVNGVARLETDLSPHDLLAALQSIEQQHGRLRTQRWAARTLDLDILLYGNERIADADLTVPHPRLLERAFVLQPLLALAPTLVLPDGSLLSDRAAATGQDGLWLLETQ
ncbi:MAG TPA: 2-amino-4-hydroxy-6-hydroxymethyldihydropteridine diphosphokinase [Pseudomonadales bacterium]|jgi:2-amino-4-hydroxy-6-hydroxymethyldihydropteridine diphosphokinase